MTGSPLVEADAGSRAAAEALVARWVEAEIADASSDVEYTELFEGRRAVRMRQQTRDYTTLWFEIGERSVIVEAYVLPAPATKQSEVYRQCLVRNTSMWRCRFGLDRHGDIVLLARTALDDFDDEELGLVVGEIYEAIEVGFRPLVRAAYGGS